MLEGKLPYVYLYGHVQAGLEVCGGESEGGGSLGQCQVWEGGQWQPGHQLSQERLLSQVWDSSSGPVILAGSLVDTNTWAERLAGGGTVVPHYLELEQRLESVTPHTTTLPHTLTPPSFREPCAITDYQTDTLVLTGGYNTNLDQMSDQVVRFGHQGKLEQLPSLNVARYGHGCASYNDGAKTVKSSLLFLELF